MKNQLIDIDQLVKRIVQDDDEHAFKMLFYHLVPKLCNYATYIIGHRQTAEEIAADVMVKFWTSRKHIEPGPRIKNFFFISAKNLAFNYLRDHTKWQYVSLDQSESVDKVQFENAESNFLDKELQTIITESISRLPQRCKMVFRLVKEEQMTYHEAAQLLDISVKTVENQMSKALRRIRLAIDTYQSTDGRNMRVLPMFVGVLLLLV